MSSSMRTETQQSLYRSQNSIAYSQPIMTTSENQGSTTHPLTTDVKTTVQTSLTNLKSQASAERNEMLGSNPTPVSNSSQS